MRPPRQPTLNWFSFSPQSREPLKQYANCVYVYSLHSLAHPRCFLYPPITRVYVCSILPSTLLYGIPCGVQTLRQTTLRLFSCFPTFASLSYSFHLDLLFSPSFSLSLFLLFLPSSYSACQHRQRRENRYYGKINMIQRRMPRSILIYTWILLCPFRLYGSNKAQLVLFTWIFKFPLREKCMTYSLSTCSLFTFRARYQILSLAFFFNTSFLILLTSSIFSFAFNRNFSTYFISRTYNE